VLEDHFSGLVSDAAGAGGQEAGIPQRGGASLGRHAAHTYPLTSEASALAQTTRPVQEEAPGGIMDNFDPIKGPELLQLAIRLYCQCEKDIDIHPMQIVGGAAEGAPFLNAVLGSRFECPKCHRQVSVVLQAQARYEREPS
jgi:DNA-directed RNA polymerase subunit M/transcription elongation factor TFIIS